MEYDFSPNYNPTVKIKVVGVGGGGNNAVDRMISANIFGVDFIAVNTDSQVLKESNATKKITIGEKITKGQGAGANPEIGKRSAEESVEAVKQELIGADMVFITTGMGGGTGTGATPVIAKIAHDLGILTVGIVTKPFVFEGKRRMAQAEAGIQELAKYVDSLIVIPNERLKQVEDARITLTNAFEIADDVLRKGVQSVSDLINKRGLINLDFADVSTVMKNAGYAHMGCGVEEGSDRAKVAAMKAISSPLLETSIVGARGVILNVAGSDSLTLEEVEEAAEMVRATAHPDANIIWGTSLEPELGDKIRITVIATGFDSMVGDAPVLPQQPAQQTPPAPKTERTEFTFMSDDAADTAEKEEMPGESFRPFFESFAQSEPEEPPTEIRSAPDAPLPPEPDYVDIFSILNGDN